MVCSYYNVLLFFSFYHVQYMKCLLFTIKYSSTILCFHTLPGVYYRACSIVLILFLPLFILIVNSYHLVFITNLFWFTRVIYPCFNCNQNIIVMHYVVQLFQFMPICLIRWKSISIQCNYSCFPLFIFNIHLFTFLSFLLCCIPCNFTLEDQFILVHACSHPRLYPNHVIYFYLTFRYLFPILKYHKLILIYVL